MRKFITIVLICIVLTGVGLISYPSVSDWYNSLRQDQHVSEYMLSLSDMQTADYDKVFEEAEAYNAALAESGMNWNLTDAQLAAYNSTLNVNGTGIMAYIDIPKLHTSMPIYHGIDEEVLKTAIGHIAGTSLPVGGGSTHCVISGHRGLPSAKLFSDIDKLVEGDTWLLSVLDRTLTYEVDQIKVVLPDELADLMIEPGQDYCTLVTCTPYGVNTHRLLVRGHRIPNLQGDARIMADAVQVKGTVVAPFVGVPLFLLLLLVWALLFRRRW